MKLESLKRYLNTFDAIPGHNPVMVLKGETIYVSDMREILQLAITGTEEQDVEKIFVVK